MDADSDQADVDDLVFEGYLGSGLFGVVWRARQSCPERMVAVKFVNRETGMAFNATAHANELVRAGPHPNIVTVYEVRKITHPEDGAEVDAIVMEWIGGKSLGERLVEKRLLTLDEARGICEGIFSGIEHLHNHDVTHSDLHEGNIILSEHGPKIIDIDYSSAKAVARLTTLNRKMAIEADISQVSAIISRMARTSTASRSRIVACERELRTATELQALREISRKIFARGLNAGLGPRDGRRGKLKMTEDLVTSVESAIERRRFATLRRLVIGEANRVAKELLGDQFDINKPATKENCRERLYSMRKLLGDLLPVCGALGFWGQGKLLSETIERLANAYEGRHSESGPFEYFHLRNYVPSVITYAGGVAAVAGRKWKAIVSILRSPDFYKFGAGRVSLRKELAQWTFKSREFWQLLNGRELLFPVSGMMETDVRDSVREKVPLESRFTEYFDQFEVIVSLDSFIRRGHAVGGNFLWRHARVNPDRDTVKELEREAEFMGEQWPLKKAGLLLESGGKTTSEVFTAFRESLSRIGLG